MSDVSTVLVVADERLVSTFLAMTVRELGFEACCCETGAEGLYLGGAEGLYVGEPSHFAAAIIDVGLPDISGAILARELRGTHPRLPIILATRHDPKTLREQFDGDRQVCVLGKPLDSTALNKVLATHTPRAARSTRKANAGKRRARSRTSARGRS